MPRIRILRRVLGYPLSIQKEIISKYPGKIDTILTYCHYSMNDFSLLNELQWFQVISLPPTDSTHPCIIFLTRCSSYFFNHLFMYLFIHSFFVHCSTCTFLNKPTSRECPLCEDSKNNHASGRLSHSLIPCSISRTHALFRRRSLDDEQDHKLGIINASAVSMGLLTHRGPPSWHPATAEIKAACKAAAEYCESQGVDIGTLAIAFTLGNEVTQNQNSQCLHSS